MQKVFLRKRTTVTGSFITGNGNVPLQYETTESCFKTLSLTLLFIQPYLCVGLNLVPWMDDSVNHSMEWAGVSQALPTADLQALRAHIQENKPFVITDGDNFAAVFGVVDQLGRISSR